MLDDKVVLIIVDGLGISGGGRGPIVYQTAYQGPQPYWGQTGAL